MAASTISGCSKKSVQNTAALSSHPSGTVTIWGWDSSEVLKDYTKTKLPDITIDYVTIQQSDLLSKIQTALASGTQMPDMVWLESGSRGKEFSLNCWEDLSKAPYNVDKNIFTNDQVPVSVNDSGDLLGLPIGPTPSAMAYKRPLAKKYLGTDDPAKIYSMIKTWDDFIKVGEKVKQESGGKVNMLTGLGDVTQVLENQIISPYVIGNKINVVDALTPVFSQLIAMKKAGIVGTNVTNSASYYASFADNVSIFYPCAQWSPRWVIEPNDKSTGRWGLSQLTGGNINWGGAVWSIPKTAKNKSGSFAVMKLLCTDPASAVPRRDQLQVFSSIKSLYNDPNFYSKSDPYFGGENVDKLFAQIVKTTQQSSIRRVSPYDSDVSDAVNAALMTLNASPDGNVDITSLLDQVQTAVLNKNPNLTK